MNRNRFSYNIFKFLIFLISFQYSAWGITPKIYSQLRIIIIASVALLFLITFKNPNKYFQKISIFRIHFSVLVSFTIIIFSLSLLGFNANFSPMFDLALALMLLMIGLNISINRKQYIKLIFLYITLNTLAALSLVYKFATGFIIYEQYLPLPKNQLAPVFGFAFILSIYHGVKINGLKKLYIFSLSILLILSMLVLRGRAALIGVFIVIFLWVVYYVRKRKNKIIYFSIFLGLLLLGWDFLYQAFFLNRNINDISNFSAGRTENYILGIKYIFSHAFMGELTGPAFKGFQNYDIHNYILINLVRYGILFSLCIFIIYFSYFFLTIKSIRKNSYDTLEAGPLLMFMLFIISQFEAGAPFASGSLIFFPFFLMGQHIKYKYM